VAHKLLWLALAGACGTVSRYAIYELAERIRPAHIPVGTIVVNIIGSFAFGFIYAAAERRLNISPETRTILLAGFMGAFTTFSTFAFETARLMKSAQWTLALANVIGQVMLGVAAMVAGVLVGRSG